MPRVEAAGSPRRSPRPSQETPARREIAFNLLKSFAAAFANWELQRADSEAGTLGLVCV